MRKVTIKRTVLTVLAVLFLASKASAAPIAIGWLQWDASAPNRFSVVNQTGVNWLGDSFYPVVTQLTFNADLTLMVQPGNVNLALNPTVGDAFSRDSVVFVGPTMATLTGTVSPLQMMLDLNGDLNGPVGGVDGPLTLWNILNGGAIVDEFGNTVVLGNGQTPIGDFGFINIYVQAEQVRGEVPEPATLLLLGSGAMGLIARRRKAARKA